MTPDRVIRVLEALKRGDCWCEVAVGNPMVAGRHAPQCRAARELLEELKAGD